MVSKNFVNVDCHDVDGNVLLVGDKVVMLDIEDLEGTYPTRGDVLIVSELKDAESNYVKFVDSEVSDLVYEFFGHRVLVLNDGLTMVKLYDTDYVVYNHKTNDVLRFDIPNCRCKEIIIYSDLEEAKRDCYDVDEVVMKTTELPNHLTRELKKQILNSSLQTLNKK